jgi:sec-independent protein translocase protein TatA
LHQEILSSFRNIQVQSDIFDEPYLHEEVTMFGLGMPELLIVLVIAIVIFGPSKLPSLGKGIGEAIRGLKKGLEEPSKEDEKKEDEKIER